MTTGAWVTAAALGAIAALAIAALWTHDHRALDAALREAREGQLRLQGLVVQGQEREASLDRRARQAEADDADLRAEVARLKVAAPEARVVGVVRAVTAPARVGPLAARPAASKPATRPPLPPAVAPASPACPGPATPPSCALAEGDSGEIRVNEVTLETREGARAIAGAASAWRLTPGPPVRLFGGPFSARLTEAASAVVAREARWGGGPWVGLGGSGVALGAAVAAPPWHFLGLRLELSMGAGIARSGQAQASAQLVVRP